MAHFIGTGMCQAVYPVSKELGLSFANWITVRE